MKRKNLLLSCLLGFVASLTTLAFASCAKVADERIFIELSAEEPYVYVDSTKTFTVEYGNSFALPEGLVYDKAGNVIDGYFADYHLYNEEGEEIMITTNYLTLSIGKYTLVYSATDYGSSAKDLTFNLIVEDPHAPKMEITSFFVNAGIVNDTIYLPTFRLTDNSGVNSTATKVSVTYEGNQVQIIDNSFVAENAGTYIYNLYTEDALGNDKTYQIPVEITEAYVDTTVTGETLMTFDNAEYDASVKPLYGTSENAKIALSNQVPDTDGVINPVGNGVAISSPDNGYFNLLFVNNKTINVFEDTVGSIVIRFYTDELIEEFFVYSGDGKTLYEAFTYIVPGWYELEINGRSCVGWYSDFSNFTIKAFNEDKANIYIDEIFYTLQWNDTQIEEDVLADFDEAEYLGIVSNNYLGMTAEFSHLTKDTQGMDETDAAAVAGANGGIVKVKQNANLDGILVPFSVPVDSTTFVGIRVRLYFVPSFDADGAFVAADFVQNSRSGFITNDGFTQSPTWGDYFSGSQGNLEPGWKDYYYAADNLRVAFKAADSNLIVSYYFSAYDLDGIHTFYIDEIEVMYGDTTVQTDVPGQFEHVDGSVGTLADFTIPAYSDNVFVATQRGSYSDGAVVPGEFGFGEFTDLDGEARSGLAVERSGNIYLGSKWSGWEGILYVLPKNLSLRNTDQSPKAGEIVIRAWFAADMSITAQWGVKNAATAAYSAYGSQAVPARYTSSVKAGWNEFTMDVKSIINEGILEISSIWFMTRGSLSAEAVNNTYYIESITFTEYIPPYQDVDFMKAYGNTDELVLADLDEEGYAVSLLSSSYGTATAQYELTSITVDSVEYDGVKLVASSSTAFGGFDVMFADDVDIQPGKLPSANYIYVRMYTPVAVANAYVNVGFIKANGTYTTDGRLVVPQRVFKSLKAGWNVLKIDVAQLGAEGVASVLGMAITVRPSYESSVADTDRYFFVDCITIDKRYEASKLPVYLEQSKITAVKEGSSVVLTWTEDANAENVTLALNGTAVAAQDGKYTIANFNANTAYRFTVTQAREGSETTVGVWYYSASFGQRVGNEFVLADFSDENYLGSVYNPEYEPNNYALAQSFFAYENGKIIVDTNGGTKPTTKSGYTYYFPFAMDNLKQLTLSASNVKDLSAANNVWGIGHYSDAFIGVFDENGNYYSLSKYCSVSGGSYGELYVTYYNTVTPTFVCDIDGLRAALEEKGETLGKIVAFTFGHNKEARVQLNYIRYVDCEFLPDPALTWKKDGSNYVVSWKEVVGAPSYTISVNGEVVNAAYTGTSYTTTQNGVVVGVKANGATGYFESSTVTTYIDPSYMTARDTTYTWLSNFDTEGTLALWQPVSFHFGALATPAWGSASPASLSWKEAAASSYLNNGKYSFSGVQFASGSGNAMNSAKYNLPEAFDLATASEIYFVVECSSWGTQSIATQLLFTSGDKYFNVSKQGGEWGSGLNPTAYSVINYDYIAQNYKRLNIRLKITADVLAAVQNALGTTKIDSMLFGRYLQSYTYTVDEIYFKPAN